MTGLILCHFVYCVVNGVIAELFCAGGDHELALAGSALCLSTLLEVGLGIPYDLSEKLRELGRMLGLLEGIALESLCDLWIALALGLAAHGEIHSYFGAFPVEMVVQAFHDFSILNLSVTEMVFTGPAETLFLHFHEFLGLCMALRALCRRVLSFIYVTANETSEFLFHNNNF